EAELFAEKKEAEETAKKGRSVSSDPVQIFGWLEKVKIADVADEMAAKLDTGALTSSLHAEEEKLFERNGQKWVRFVITEPGVVGGKRHVMEALLVRTAEIKEPGGLTERRCVVRLNFLIGERSVRAEFTLNDRKNMLCPVLLGRSALSILGWVDPSRTYLADDKIFR
ncbi:MAG: ATP-dependent zinc protease, partial [Verrucomicrobia bacterium]|nr:ATP-dependent zinc protease [Verrucomicrobiota bacterium]